MIFAWASGCILTLPSRLDPDTPPSCSPWSTVLPLRAFFPDPQKPRLFPALIRCLSSSLDRIPALPFDHTPTLPKASEESGVSGERPQFGSRLSPLSPASQHGAKSDGNNESYAQSAFGKSTAVPQGEVDATEGELPIIADARLGDSLRKTLHFLHCVMANSSSRLSLLLLKQFSHRPCSCSHHQKLLHFPASA
ncbi:Wd Repeat And Fyve Domain-Containing Protein 3 [Manis pentadactyla]|nr:Wd Repeat And Fyve Domain-Containing Protein 3 [Manis pentadactyla]